MNEPQTTTEHQVFEIAYDQRSSTWGHYMEWLEWKYLDNESFHQVGHFAGQLTETLQVGDHFILLGNDTEEETLLLLEVVWVQYERGAGGLFHCDAVLLGRTEELTSEEDDGAEDAPNNGGL